jgi:carbonic anhydrase
MKNLIDGMAKFCTEIFPQQRELYEKLAGSGQAPKALMISCADSRVVPEMITQVGPGELFVCRNAGNIVPPFAQSNGGVSSVIEYAVVALGVHDIVVCGHSGCGAMKARLNVDSLNAMPNVRSWLRHADAAYAIVCEAYPSDLDEVAKLHALGLENVMAQLNHLRTHPSVAARIASGDIGLHGWFFEIEVGRILALDGKTGKFVPLDTNLTETPVALARRRRTVADDNPQPLGI